MLKFKDNLEWSRDFEVGIGDDGILEFLDNDQRFTRRPPGFYLIMAHSGALSYQVVTT